MTVGTITEVEAPNSLAGKLPRPSDSLDQHAAEAALRWRATSGNKRSRATARSRLTDGEAMHDLGA